MDEIKLKTPTEDSEMIHVWFHVASVYFQMLITFKHKICWFVNINALFVPGRPKFNQEMFEIKLDLFFFKSGTAQPLNDNVT